MTPERVKEIATAALSDTPVLEEAEWLSLCATGLPTAEWPETDLRVCAVCCETGERAAFRKDSGVDLLNAVAASCAIPSIFPTVEIRGLHYADGGVWSGGNCDLLLEEEVDVAIFIGSMLGETGTGRVSRRTLEREIKMFADRALTLRTVTPGADFPSGEGASMNPANRELALEAGLADGAAAAPLFHRTPSL